MRAYGKKFLKNKMKEPSQNTIETRDSIIWDVNVPQRYCRVKIQGSNELVVAYFPQGWQETPSWMKPGISAKINHMGGVRGRIELLGPGQFVPTPVSGGSLPTPGTPPDAVMTGCHVGASTPNAMSVTVAAGTYRIGGVTYSTAGGTLALSAAPAVGQYRYDVIYGDTSGTVHIQEGTASSDPVMPTIPANTVQLGYVLVYGGMTVVTPVWTNKAWADEVPSSVTVVPDDDDLAWAETSTAVTVSVFDQYGNPYSEAAPGLYLTLEFQETGNGTLHSDEEGDSTTKIGAHTGAGSNHYHFLYTRDQLATDLSPTLKGTNETTKVVSGYGSILLRDQNGDPMAGPGGEPPYEIPNAYDTVQDEGVNLLQRKKINFIGDGVIAADNPVTQVTDVLISGGGGGPSGGGDMNLSLFPEYAGAVMSPSGSNNDPGSLGMTSDFEAVANSIKNYYQWKSSITSGLQSYDINTKIRMPYNFGGFQTGVGVALTVEIKTEENAITNNKIDVIIQKDGSATTSSLTDQKSSVAATWETIGFDETDAVLASLGVDNVLNVKIRLYSKSSKYVRVGRINLELIRGTS